MSSRDDAIVAENVTMKFGDFVALDGVGLRASRGKVTALLGPNGAGKTTLIKAMTTLIKPSEGTILINGVDVIKNPDKTRNQIGLAGQYAAVDDFLTGRETLEMVARLYHMMPNQAKVKADELLEKLGLSEAGDRQIKTYSGGMRRRLDLGASLVATPEVLFLDEPTTGLDPRTRNQLWEIIRDLVKNGVTILLTTQYLEEVDALADNIFVINKGKMIAEGTAEKLKNSLGKDVIEVKVSDDKIAKLTKVLEKAGFEPEKDELTSRVKVQTSKGSEDLLKVAEAVNGANLKASELSLHRPSLDDVFLSLTDEKPDQKVEEE